MQPTRFSSGIKAVLVCVMCLAGAISTATAASSSSVSTSASTSSARPAPDPTVPPAGYTRCNGSDCFSGIRQVVINYCFGPSFEYYCGGASKLARADFSCNPAAFGVRPASPHGSWNSACFYKADAPVSGTATASTQSGSARGASAAVDGREDSRWEASNTSPGTWLQLTFPKLTNVATIQLREYGDRIRGFRLEYRQGGQWVQFQSGATLGALTAQANVVTDAVRLVTTQKANGQPSITEMSATEAPPLAATTVQNTIVVPAGQTFDGGGHAFLAGAALTGPIFDLGAGASLKNVNLDVLAPLDAVVTTRGNATLDGIKWRTVNDGYALDMMGAGAVTIKNSMTGESRGNALFKVSGAGSSLQLEEFNAFYYTGIVTQEPGTRYAVSVRFTQATIAGAHYLFRTDSASSTVAVTSGNICGIQSRYIGVAAQNITETSIGSMCTMMY